MCIFEAMPVIDEKWIAEIKIASTFCFYFMKPEYRISISFDNIQLCIRISELLMFITLSTIWSNCCAKNFQGYTYVY